MKITLQELARECLCDVVTVRKWVLSNNVLTIWIKCVGNNKKAKAISVEDGKKFRSYWDNLGVIPDGYITISELAKRCDVDINTVKKWAARNDVGLISKPRKGGFPDQLVCKKAEVMFCEEYVSKNDAVSVRSLLDKHKSDFRVAERWAKRTNTKFVKVKSGAKSQKGLLIEDADKFEQFLKELKSAGKFYLIQLIPEYNPNRIKMGYARDVERRLFEHRTTCPNAILLHSWDCPRHLEKKAIREIAKAAGCQKIGDEVFESIDYKNLIASANSHFN